MYEYVCMYVCICAGVYIMWASVSLLVAVAPRRPYAVPVITNLLIYMYIGRIAIGRVASQIKNVHTQIH